MWSPGELLGYSPGFLGRCSDGGHYPKMLQYKHIVSVKWMINSGLGVCVILALSYVFVHAHFAHSTMNGSAAFETQNICS